MRISDWSSDVCSSDLMIRKRVSGRDAAAGQMVEDRQSAMDVQATAIEIGGDQPRQLIYFRRLRLLFTHPPLVGDKHIGAHQRSAADGEPTQPLWPRYCAKRQIGRASCRERVCQYV